MCKNNIFKRVLALLLVLISLFQLVACSSEEFAKHVYKEALQQAIGNIKDTVISKSEEWFFGVSVDIEDWWTDVVASGQDIAQKANDKFQEITSAMSNKKDELIDTVVTNAALGIYNNAQENFNGNIITTENTFVNQEGFSEEDAFYDYDTEAFVYKLVVSVFPENYEVFPAILCTTAGESVVGIAYTDFSVKMQTEDASDNKVYYAAGFVSAVGETLIPEEDVNSGLQIYPADVEENVKESFFLAYLPDAYETHCVALGKYFVFGIDENAQVTYTCEDYNADCAVRSDLGELYSFDANGIVAYEGTTSIFTESPFVGTLRYYNRSVDEIKAELYEYFKDYKLDISFLKISDIFERGKALTEKVFARNNISYDLSQLSINDLVGVEIFSKNMPEESSNLEKWIVGTACVMLIFGTMAGQVFRIINPAFGVAVGASIGAAVEVFVQVVLENTAVADLNYRKTAIAAISGAISSNLGIVGDAVVGGLTEGIYALLDGESFSEVLKGMCYGVMAGMTLGIAIHGLIKIIGVGAKTISSKLAKSSSDMLADGVGTINGNAVKKVSDVGDDAVNYASKKAANQVVDAAYYDEAVTKYQKILNDTLPSPKNNNFKYLDVDGNYVDRKVYNGYIEINDPAKKEIFKNVDGAIVNKIEIANGAVKFEALGYPEIQLEDGALSAVNRNLTFKKADERLAEVWRTSPEKIPAQYQEYFASKGVNLSSLKANDIDNWCKDMKIVRHEGIDMKTITYLPHEIHTGSLGGIPHVGGYSLANLAKLYNLDRNALYAYITAVV